MPKKLIAAVLIVVHMLTWTAVCAANPFISSDTLATLKEVWSAQTFEQLKDGNIILPESVVNEYFTKVVEEYPDIKEVSVSVKDNNQLEIVMNTNKMGHILIDGVIEDFHHNQENSQLTFRVTKKKMLDHKFVSWFFSNMSISMLSKIFGHIDASDGITVSTEGNAIIVDFHDYLYTYTSLGKLNIMEKRMPDLVVVKGISTHQGCLEIKTVLDMPAVIFGIVDKVIGG